MPLFGWACQRAQATPDKTLGGARVNDDIFAHPPDSTHREPGEAPFGFFRQVLCIS